MTEKPVRTGLPEGGDQLKRVGLDLGGDDLGGRF